MVGQVVDVGALTEFSNTRRRTNVAPEPQNEGARPAFAERERDHSDQHGRGHQPLDQGPGDATTPGGQGDPADECVDADAQSKGRCQPKDGQEDQTGENGPQHCPHRVDGEHSTDRSAGRTEVGRDHAAGQRQGHTQAYGGHEEHTETDKHLDQFIQRIGRRPPGDDVGKMGKGVRNEVVEKHRDQQRAGQRPFGDSEGDERVVAPAPGGHQCAADGDTTDERGQHQRVGVGAGPERQGQQAGPSHLIEHGHEAGQAGGHQRHPALQRREGLVGRGTCNRLNWLIETLAAAGT